jgi:hypothetical protein
MEVEEGQETTTLDNATKKRVLMDVVAGWTQKEVARFLANIECDWKKARYESLDEHWIFLPTHHSIESQTVKGDRLMYRVASNWYCPANRVCCCLFKRFDPQGTHDIVMQCGHDNCVHPEHMLLVEKKAYKKRRVNVTNIEDNK